MKNVIQKLLLSLSLLSNPACFEDAPAGTLAFVTPEEGEQSFSDVNVKIALTDLQLEQSGTHLWLLVDEPCLAIGQEITSSGSRLDLGLHSEISLMLGVGDHELCAQTSDAAGIIDGPSDTVRFTVKARAAMGVEILEPLDGSAHGRSVLVQLRSTGLRIVPLGPLVEGEGHFFLRIDRECPGPDVKVPRDGATWDLTQGQSSMLLDLDYGWRDICAGIANNHDDVLPGTAQVRVLIGY